ncbi:hypothetical protein CEP52_010709 [Fusarium oligoseptatum]|uniref:Uncharacterized protein n=1 Tax=Fusarium oligoseptatum TaxID=2604345 RepID=A0A428T6X6_9HYPO|nr:hypothetical protein CEP52_010709 [Fusarium oligoseptatum]
MREDPSLVACFDAQHGLIDCNGTLTRTHCGTVRAQRANYPASSPTTTPFRVYRSYPPALSRYYYTMARGDDALAGREERNVPSHRFEPRETDEKINFQGQYISIYNQKTQHRHLLEENVQECKSYAVPKGYTVYIRSADVVYWDV